MFQKPISLVLIAILLQSVLHTPALGKEQEAQQQTVSQMREVLSSAAAQHKTIKVRLKRRIDNRSKFTGIPREVSDSNFVLTGGKTGAATKVDFADVQEVKRTGMSKAAKVGIGIGIGLAVLIVVAVLVFKPWRSE